MRYLVTGAPGWLGTEFIKSLTGHTRSLIELKNNLEELTSLPVLGSVQHVDNFQLEKFIEIFSQNIELEKFL